MAAVGLAARTTPRREPTEATPFLPQSPATAAAAEAARRGIAPLRLENLEAPAAVVVTFWRAGRSLEAVAQQIKGIQVAQAALKETAQIPILVAVAAQVAPAAQAKLVKLEARQVLDCLAQSPERALREQAAAVLVLDSVEQEVLEQPVAETAGQPTQIKVRQGLQILAAAAAEVAVAQRAEAQQAALA